MSFPIVGIGTSAGGLEAVSELLASLPAESGLALLLVQHLDPGGDMPRTASRLGCVDFILAPAEIAGSSRLSPGIPI